MRINWKRVKTIYDQCCDGCVEFLEQFVLLQDARVVDIPTCTVQKIQVVRDFDETNATFDQSATEQATLTELAALPRAQIGGLSIQLKDLRELGTAQL